MKNVRLSKRLIIPLVFITNTALSQTSWEITDDYTIAFSGRGAEGTFRGLRGDITFDPNDLTRSKFDVTIDPSTIATGNKTKDGHARGDSWFNVEKYTVIAFVSENIERSGPAFIVYGDLLLHGVRSKAEINFTFNQESEKNAVFRGNLKVSREQYGIEGPLVSFMVGDEFEVEVTVQVERKE